MKKTAILVLLLFINFTFSQNKEAADKLVEEGIPYHDKGDYDGAINKYNQALELDKNNVFALAEKAYTLFSLDKFEETIVVCKLAIEKHPDENILKIVYVTYGNALDALKKTDKAFEIYDQGLKKFPDNYQLYFNKGVTYASIAKYEDAILCFQKALLLNPKHSSSNNGIAKLEIIKNKRIPAILALCRFLIIEPQTDRSKENLKSLKELMNANVEKTGDNSITINLNSQMIPESDKKKKAVENDFSSTDLISTMDVALDFDKENKDKTEVENFIRKFETICASLKETKKNNFGFYWEVYAPYFIDMKKNNLIVPFAYIVYATSETKDVIDWFENKENEKELDRFYEWSQNYNWKITK